MIMTRSALKRKDSIIMSAVFPEPVGIEINAGSELAVKCASVDHAAPI
jgi:hypothetical protein